LAALSTAAIFYALSFLFPTRPSSQPLEELALAATSGAKRPMWFPDAVPAPHLTGEFPGDRGFDPVDFSADPAAFERMRASEVFHGRLAMLGAAGCLIPELLGKGAWFKAGESADLGQFALIVLLASFPLEYWRGNGGLGWGQNEKQKGNRIYPGFDPLKMTSDDTKTKEIKNGRLAMLACLGLFSQAYITGASPLENLGLSSSIGMFAAAGAKRPTWIPGGSAPAYLTGEFPADRGFDPLGFSKDPASFERMRAAEVFHSRLAMLGVVGAVLPELQGRGTWYDVTSAQWGPGPNGEVIGFTELSVIFLLFIYPLEYWRGNGGFGWGEEKGDRTYPGFDPLNLTNFDYKVAEIKNGRLAMTAFLGLVVQHATTGGSPVDNLAAFVGSTAMFAASGAKRPVWFPDAVPAPHLTGEFPGDRGFDPVDFSADPAAFERMRASEVFHGRLAMLGAAGCLIPELLGKGAWFKAGESVDLGQFALIVMLASFPLEYWRGNGGLGWGQNEKQKGNRIYPGFDPLKMTSDDTKTKEIKNGRLAMLACLGLFSQAYITGASPLENLGLSSSSIGMFAAAGAKRPTWIPGGSAPSYLTGEFPADRGFDPLGFSKDPASFERMRAAEVFHSRLAMLGVVGAVLPELQGRGAWYDVTSAQWGPGPNGEVIGFTELSVIFLLFIYPLEYWRGNGGFGWGEEKGDRTYPGFNPLNLTNFDYKVAEIKNGRLAMTAFLGLVVQHATTGGSPVDNLAAFVGSTAMFAATGAKRPTWIPGGSAPAHLTGEFPGDRGFDPLGLAKDPSTFERMRASEVFHCRLAMLGVVGAVLPELQGRGAWYDVTSAQWGPGPNGEVIGFTELSLIFLLFIYPLEYWRGNGGFGWGEEKGDRTYPGFDPLNLTNFDYKVAEIKNGRLAMTAFLGLVVQHATTGGSPLENLAVFVTSGAKRPVWFPDAVPAPHLTGEFPGDRGFDPVDFSADPAAFERMRASEVFHGRLAMLGTAGCLIPELLGKGTWFNAGETVDLAEFGLIVMLAAFPLEYWRGNGGLGWGQNEKQKGNRIYPGFDPLKMTSDDTKTKEIKNGRLAMVAFLGLVSQAYITGASPFENLGL
jgi:light-harvesting complex I chlorophyll a/b binding protein 1